MPRYHVNLRGSRVGDQLFLERFIWFDNEARHGRYPKATRLAEQFELSTKTAHRSIDYFRDRLQAPFEYDESRKGYFYTDPSFQLPIMRLSQDELLGPATIPASHEVEIMMEILKHGSHVELLEPEWLRGKVAEEVSRAHTNYTIRSQQL